MSPFPRGLVFPATAAVTLPAMTPHLLYALAREIAMEINELPMILQNYSLTPEQYERIRESNTFQRILGTEIQQWSSARNTPERVRIEAAATFEQFLPHLQSRLLNEKENLNHVVEGGKLMAKVAGIDQSDQPPDAGEKFIINIDIGDKSMHVVQSAVPLNSDGSMLTHKPATNTLQRA
jgi:hypothetical protein